MRKTKLAVQTIGQSLRQDYEVYLTRMRAFYNGRANLKDIANYLEHWKYLLNKYYNELGEEKNAGLRRMANTNSPEFVALIMEAEHILKLLHDLKVIVDLNYKFLVKEDHDRIYNKIDNRMHKFEKRYRKSPGILHHAIARAEIAAPPAQSNISPWLTRGVWLINLLKAIKDRIKGDAAKELQNFKKFK
jgi:hypothetical protein